MANRKMPPGARMVGGKMLVPFQGKRPAKGTMTGQVGNYAAPVDTTGMDPEMIRLMQRKKSTHGNMPWNIGG